MTNIDLDYTSVSSIYYLSYFAFSPVAVKWKFAFPCLPNDTSKTKFKLLEITILFRNNIAQELFNKKKKKNNKKKQLQ